MQSLERVGEKECKEGKGKKDKTISRNSVYPICRFSDWTRAEFATMLGSRRAEGDVPVPISAIEAIIGEERGREEVPDSMDWGPHLTAVKDQGHCGSCWAHAAVETIESYRSISGKGLEELSVQQIVSCDLSGVSNCDGGNYGSAFNYVKNSGIEKLSDYPTVSGHSTCLRCQNHAKRKNLYPRLSKSMTILHFTVSNNCHGSLGIQGNAGYCVQKYFNSRCLSVPNSCPSGKSFNHATSSFCLDGQCNVDHYGTLLRTFCFKTRPIEGRFCNSLTIFAPCRLL